MSYNFLLIGGDMRIFLLAKKIANDENNVKIMGFEKIPISEIVNNNINVIQTIEEAEENDIIISSIPLSIDGENIYAPYSDKQIKLEITENTSDISNITVCLKNSTFTFENLFFFKFLYNFIPLSERINIIGKKIKFCNNNDAIENVAPCFTPNVAIIAETVYPSEKPL